LKTFSARRINVLRQARGMPFWQRNYYEHIIRNERALNAIREYIGNNPVNWEADQLHPDAASNRFNAEWR
jgi:putative transposase